MDDDLLTQKVWTNTFLLSSLQLTAIVLVGYLYLIILFFRKNSAAAGLLCTLLLPCVGFGWVLGAFVGLMFGWTMAKKWSIRSFMAFWSATIVLAIVNYALFLIMVRMQLDEWLDHFGWLPRSRF